MNRFHLLLCGCFLLFFGDSGNGADVNPAVLPFSVQIDGQEAAVTKKDSSHASIARPVPDDAVIKVGVKVKKSSTIIINMYVADADGKPKSGKKPVVIILTGTNSGKLSESVDGTKPSPGHYRMNIVAGGKTAIVIFEVK